MTEVSEWAVDEVAARLRVSGRVASGLLAESVELVEQLPATLAALEVGDISWAQARALVELLRPVAEGKKALVEARVLPRAPRQTVAQLRACTKRAIARIDADAAVRRLVRAVRDRKVTVHPGEDGMAVLTAWLPAPVARACLEALRAYAEACGVDEDGRSDPRSRDERMADCLADLILRPDAEGRSPVQVLLTVVAAAGTLTGTGPDAEEPGEVDGQTVPAALVRELAHAFGLMPRPTAAAAPCTDTTAGAITAPADKAVSADGAVSTGGAVPAEDGASVRGVEVAQAVSSADEIPRVEDTAPSGDAAPTRDIDRDRDDQADATGSDTDIAEPQAREGLAALLDMRRIAETALAERPRIAVADELTGCLLALTDSIELRRAARDGEGLAPPGETDGYRPSRPLDRFVRLRDRRCRFPGCRARIRTCDLDHRVPYPHGPTAHDNLDGLCEHHHRLSHQAPGWRLGGSPDGGLVWTLPGGTTITTVPPRFGTDEGNEPTGRIEREESAGASVDWRRLTPEERRARMRALVVGRPRRPDDEPAPF